MAIVLCIETATTNCSVALSVNGSVIALQEDRTKNYSHAEQLHVFINEVLSKANVEKNKLDAIAVSKGPGSYTGLRIGVSAAKGLCYALDIPLISVLTLQVLALQVQQEIDFIVPMLDARRMEVYAAIFDGNLNVLRTTEAEILTANSFDMLLEKGKTIFIGNGAEKFQEICTHKHAVFINDAMPSANELAALVQEKWEQQDFENVAYFEPHYLKDFRKG